MPDEVPFYEFNVEVWCAISAVRKHAIGRIFFSDTLNSESFIGNIFARFEILNDEDRWNSVI